MHVCMLIFRNVITLTENVAIFPLFSRHGLKTKSHAVLKETKTVRIIKV